MNKVLSVADLIAKKKDKKEKIVRLFVPSLKGEIEAKAPDKILVSNSLDMSKNGDRLDGDVYLVYHSIVHPNLQDKELQQAYDCLEPMDIVSQVFLPGEISSVALRLLEEAGYNSEVKVVSEVKN